MKKYWLLSFILLLTVSSQSQIIGGFEKRNKERKNGKYVTQGDRGKAIYSHSRSQYRPFGWHANVGLTYMIGNNSDKPNDATRPIPSFPGYYLEGGFAHLFRRYHKVFHYIDYGIGIKHYSGTEEYRFQNGEPIRGGFDFGSIFGRFGIHSAWQLSEWNWIDQSIGFNIDYRVYGGKIDNNYASLLVNQDTQEKLVGQLHYSIGWGYKPREGLYFIPTLQTPILTALTWRNFNPGTHWFSTKYQPIIFMLKMGVLLPKKGCPKVFSKDAQRQSEQYQNR